MPHDPRKAISAEELLTDAAQIMRERAVQYDKPGGERSMRQTVEAFNAITGKKMTETEGWLLLSLLKNVRLFQNHSLHLDSVQDNVAYAALMGESRINEFRKPEQSPVNL